MEEVAQQMETLMEQEFAVVLQFAFVDDVVVFRLLRFFLSCIASSFRFGSSSCFEASVYCVLHAVGFLFRSPLGFPLSFPI